MFWKKKQVLHNPNIVYLPTHHLLGRYVHWYHRETKNYCNDFSMPPILCSYLPTIFSIGTYIVRHGDACSMSPGVVFLPTHHLLGKHLHYCHAVTKLKIVLHPHPHVVFLPTNHLHGKYLHWGHGVTKNYCNEFSMPPMLCSYLPTNAW